ncbi:MAG: DUF4861 family protein [Bacteroidales bacterium]
MKKYMYSVLLMSAMLSTACTQSVDIVVLNNSDVDRPSEMVEICACELPDMSSGDWILVDTSGQQLPFQLINKGESNDASLIFPADVNAGTEVRYSIVKGKTETFDSKVFVRQITERKDDITWENDKVAFRMYGPALAAENPSNGVDVWFKRTPELIVNKWYKADLAGEASYHEDHGEGLDCYKVGHTLGAGSIAPFIHDSLFVGGHYDRVKILENGPLRASFVLFYDNIPFAGNTQGVSAEMKITLDAGSHLNEMQVRYTGEVSDFQLASGIFLHDTIQNVMGLPEQGYLAYAEGMWSQTKQPQFSGRGFIGLVFPENAVEYRMIPEHVVALTPYKMGEVYRYYFGAGWDQYLTPSDQAWVQYLSNKRDALKHPLEVRIIK